MLKMDDLVRGYDGWLARVKGKTTKNVSIVWETGPLKGRAALVPKEDLRKVG